MKKKNKMTISDLRMVYQYLHHTSGFDEPFGSLKFDDAKAIWKEVEKNERNY